LQSVLPEKLVAVFQLINAQKFQTSEHGPPFACSSITPPSNQCLPCSGMGGCFEIGGRHEFRVLGLHRLRAGRLGLQEMKKVDE